MSSKRAPLLQQRLARVSETARVRLNDLDGLVPPQAPQGMPFEEYVARASVHAQRDPAFRSQFETAMQQYQAARSVTNGPKLG